MTRYKLRRETKFGCLVVFLNRLPLNKTMFQSAMIERMNEGEFKTYVRYIGMLHRKAFVFKAGKGKNAVVKRLRPIPQVKLRTDVVNDYL